MQSYSVLWGTVQLKYFRVFTLYTVSSLQFQVEGTVLDCTDSTDSSVDALTLRLAHKIMLNARLFMTLMLQRDSFDMPNLETLAEKVHELHELAKKSNEVCVVLVIIFVPPTW